MQTRGNRTRIRRQDLKRELGVALFGLRGEHHLGSRELDLQCRTRRALVGIDERCGGRRRPLDRILRITIDFDDIETLVARRHHTTTTVRLLVGVAIAVVVNSVATVSFFWTDLSIGVIAVTRLARRAIEIGHRRVAITVIVVVATFIGAAIAVVIDSVAEFRTAREGSLVAVIAIRLVCDIALRSQTCHDRRIEITILVRIRVLVERE